MNGQRWLAALPILLLMAAPVLAHEAGDPAGLYDRPTLVLDPGMHTAMITRAGVDVAGRYAVTGSLDETARVWSVEDGRLLQTIRLPAGPERLGKVYAVALSPDGELIAVGGWMSPVPPNYIYIFERATGAMVERIEGLPEVVLHLSFSADARGFLRWHVNRGWDSAAEAIPVSDIPEQHRPEVLPVVLQELNFVTALGIVEQREMWDAIQRRTNSVVPPGTQLHVLAIGVGDYNEEWAKHLRLEFADDDALDVASALFNTQGSLYPRSTRKSCATGRPPAPASSAPSAPFRRRCRG